MKCKRCGAEIRNNTLLCVGCGTAISVLKEQNDIVNDNEMVETNNTKIEVDQNIEDSLSMLDNEVFGDTFIPFNSKTNEVKIEKKYEPEINVEKQQPEINSLKNEIKENKIDTIVNKEVSNEKDSIMLDEQANKLLKMEKFKKIGIGFGLILILIIAFFTYMFFLASKKDRVFKTAIDTIFSFVSDNINTDFETVSGSLKLKVNNDYDATLSYGIDYTKRIINLDLDSNKDNKELLDCKLTAFNGSMYVYLDKIFNKYIMFDNVNFDEYFEKSDNAKDLKIILEELNKATSNSINNKYLTNSDASITVNGKETKVKGTILTIDSKNLKSIEIDILTYLKKSKSFVNSYSKVSAVKVDDVNKLIDSYIESISKATYSDFAPIKVTIYTKGITNKFVGFNINSGNNGFVMIKNNDTNYSYNVIYNDKEVSKGLIDIKKIEDGKNINFSTDGISINLEYTLKYNETIEKEEVKSSVFYNKLTDSELSTINKNISNNEILNTIEEIFKSFNQTSVLRQEEIENNVVNYVNSVENDIAGLDKVDGIYIVEGKGLYKARYVTDHYEKLYSNANLNVNFDGVIFTSPMNSTYNVNMISISKNVVTKANLYYDGVYVSYFYDEKTGQINHCSSTEKFPASAKTCQS